MYKIILELPFNTTAVHQTDFKTRGEALEFIRTHPVFKDYRCVPRSQVCQKAIQVPIARGS